MVVRRGPELEASQPAQLGGVSRNANQEKKEQSRRMGGSEILNILVCGGHGSPNASIQVSGCCSEGPPGPEPKLRSVNRSIGSKQPGGYPRRGSVISKTLATG
jgi:hypothetical protein